MADPAYNDPYQKPEQRGLFGKKPQTPPSIPLEVSQELRDMSRRLRLLEEKYTNLRKNFIVTEQNMISDHKRIATEIKATNADIGEIRSDIHELKEELKLVIRELKDSAKKDEVQVLEKYINFWQPLNFVTQKQVEGIVKRLMQTKDL